MVLCKSCRHCHIKSMRNIRAEDAVCGAPEPFTGLPKGTRCVDERASDKPNDCGPNAKLFQKI